MYENFSFLQKVLIEINKRLKLIFQIEFQKKSGFQWNDSKVCKKFLKEKIYYNQESNGKNKYIDNKIIKYNINDWDITVFCRIFLLPYFCEKNRNYFIKNLRTIRNELAHATTLIISNENLQNYLKRLEEIMLSFHISENEIQYILENKKEESNKINNKFLELKKEGNTFYSQKNYEKNKKIDNLQTELKTINKNNTEFTNQIIDNFNLNNYFEKISESFYLRNFKNTLNIINDVLNFTNLNLHENDKIYLFLLKGLCLFELNRFLEAKECFFDILKIDSKNYYALYELGNVYELLNDYEKSLEFFDKCLLIKPNDLLALNGKTNALLYKKEYLNALDINTENLKINSKSKDLNHLAKSYELQGKILFFLKRFDEAIENNDKSINLNPTNCENYNNKGNCLFSKNEFEKALENFDICLEINPLHIHANANKGMCYLKLENIEEAKNSFKKHLKNYPNDEMAKIELHIANNLADNEILRIKPLIKNENDVIDFQKVRKNLERINDLIKILKNEKDLIKELLIKKGFYLLRLNLTEEAKECFFELLKIDSQNLYALFELGIIFKFLKNFTKALDFFLKCLLLKPNNLLYLNHKVDVLICQKNYLQALKINTKNLKINSNSKDLINLSDAYKLQGLLLFFKKRFDEAIINNDISIKLNPNNFENYNNKGKCLFSKNEFEKALENFEMCLKINPLHISANANKGICYLQLENNEEAKNSFKKHLKNYPNDEMAKIELNQIEKNKTLMSKLLKNDIFVMDFKFCIFFIFFIFCTFVSFHLYFKI